MSATRTETADARVETADDVLEAAAAVNRRASARASKAKAAAAPKAEASSRPSLAAFATTAEFVVPAAEVEFLEAMAAYKVSSGRMFPTWSEVLEVLQGLGYQKRAAASPRWARPS